MKACIAFVFAFCLVTMGLAQAQLSVAGRWERAGKDNKRTYDFTVTGEALEGTIEDSGARSLIESGKVLDSGKTISLTWTTTLPDGNEITRTAKGTVTADQIDLAIDGLIASTRVPFKESEILKRVK